MATAVQDRGGGTYTCATLTFIHFPVVFQLFIHACYITLCKPAELFLVSEYIWKILINIDVYAAAFRDGMHSPSLRVSVNCQVGYKILLHNL